MPESRTVLRRVGYLATCPAATPQADIAPIRDAALAFADGRILWTGSDGDLPDEYASWPSQDLSGRTVIPGLIDCHTHLAFGGWRADEFERRLAGTGYLEIARAGGGILRTVRDTREASEEDLVLKAHSALSEMARLGVTSVECKSGYGLDLANEIKLLRVYRTLTERQPLRIVATFLGAHTIPPEFLGDRKGYIRLLVEEMIPAVAEQELARFCDVFVEDTAFQPEEAERILQCGRRHGLAAKLHVDQLSDSAGAELAVDLEAASADHLECISQRGIEKMAESGRTVAVDLPLASVYLNQPLMPARRLIEAGVPVAVATDFNPGSAPSFHLPLAMWLACTLQRLTPAEVLKGATAIAARAIGVEDETGSLEVGKSADFAVLDAPDVNHWMYHFRANSCLSAYVGGRAVF